MSPVVLFTFVITYFIVLLLLAYFTSRNSSNESFFIGNRNSNWMLVAFGMIGTSLSGVTFISVPGTVGDFIGDQHKAFAYFQVVIGYFIGYIVIAYVLLPLYYRLHLTSIYHYLQERFGITAYKTGAAFFIISRTIGATGRLYLVINVLQVFILDEMHVPFIVTAIFILLMIILYTFKGGVKTIVYTDTLQTLCMLIGLVVCIIYILSTLDLSFGEAIGNMRADGLTHVFNTDMNSKYFFVKQIIGGMFITIAMTGLDQEMMQKNISVKTLGGSRKNMLSFSFIIVIVNFLFLCLGGLLVLFMQHQGAVYESNALLYQGGNVIGDDLFPTAALQIFPQVISVIFIVALISALFPSADGALTALTSSFCIDIIGVKRNSQLNEAAMKKTRITVHMIFAAVFLVCIVIFKMINDKSIISVILDLAGYTYGPLLGLFAFGIFTRRQLPNSAAVPVICLLSPVLCYLLSYQSGSMLGSYKIGIELLLINGILTFTGLYLISSAKKSLIKSSL